MKFISSEIKPENNQKIYLAESETPLSYSLGKFVNGKFYSDLYDYEVFVNFWLPRNKIIEYQNNL